MNGGVALADGKRKVICDMTNKFMGFKGSETISARREMTNESTWKEIGKGVHAG